MSVFDAAQLAAYRRDGYVLVQSLLNAAEVRRVLEFARTDAQLEAGAYGRNDATGCQTTAWRRCRAARCGGLRRGNRQALAPLGATPLQDQSPVLGAHPHEKAVSAPAPTPVRLERTLHDVRSLGTIDSMRRNLDSSEPSRQVSING